LKEEYQCEDSLTGWLLVAIAYIVFVLLEPSLFSLLADLLYNNNKA
jgi:hypothetical protein